MTTLPTLCIMGKLVWRGVRARLHQVSVSTLQQLCHDASDSTLIEINGDA